MKKQSLFRTQQASKPHNPRKPPEGPHQRKRQGELAELAFMYKAASLGFGVAKPYGESEHFDFIVTSGRRVCRVQVKSTSRTDERGYHVNACHRGQKPYRSDEVDFIVVYIVPENAWYVIPIEAIGGRHTLYFLPNGSRWGSCRYEKYREAWWLMRPDYRFQAVKK